MDSSGDNRADPPSPTVRRFDRRTIQLMGERISIWGDADDSEFQAWPPGEDRTDSVIAFLRWLVDQRIVEPSADAIDVGANIGAVTLALSRLLPQGKILAVEPLSKNFEVLHRNVSEHAVNASCVQVALGEDEGEVDFAYSPGFGAGAHINQGTLHPTGEWHTQVPIRRLDTIASEHDVLEARIVKVDVEGFELNVLAGAPGLLALRRAIFVSEFNHMAFWMNANVTPTTALSRFRASFPYVYVLDRKTPVLRRIGHDSDAYRFLWVNGVTGPVDNIVGSFEELSGQAENYWNWWEREGLTRLHLDTAVAEELAAIYSTVSWRITQPLRAVRALQQRVLRRRDRA